MEAARTVIEEIKGALETIENIGKVMASEAAVQLLIAELIDLFSMVYDSRVQGRCTYSAGEVLTGVFVGVLCGNNNWVELEIFMKNRQEWFFEFFPSMREAGKTPSHDSLNRIFSKVDIEQVQIAGTTFIREHMADIMERVGCKAPEYKIMCIDGKQERGTGRSYNAKAGREVKDMQTLHVYDASTMTVDAAKPIDEKTNEIPTAAQYLEELESAKGMIFTGDAMHAQKAATCIIREKGGDYCFGTKGNQGNLYKDAKSLFTPEIMGEIKKGGCYVRTSEKAHGGIETREYYVADLETYKGICLDGWTDLRAITLCEKTITPLSGGEAKKERRYYISSMVDPEMVATAIRGHWAVESVLHETLDKDFLCDANTTMNWDSATNLFSLYKIAFPAINLVEPMVWGASVKNVRHSINDDFNNSLRKISWLFDPSLSSRIKSLVSEKFSRLGKLRKERERKMQGKVAMPA